MEAERPSLFIPCGDSALEQRILAVLNQNDSQNSWMGCWHSVRQIYQLPCLCQTPDEEVYMVIGTTVPKISTHPIPDPFKKFLIFVAGEGRTADLEIYNKIRAVYRAKLLAQDQAALLDVAEIIGRTVTSSLFRWNNPMPILTERQMDELRKLYGTSIPKDVNMQPEWLTVVHLPQLQIADGTVFVQLWGRPGANYDYRYESSGDEPLWRVTAIITEDNIKTKTRRILHCYEDQVSQQMGSGNFKKNLNYKLFDAAFMHLVKRRFTGNEEGYTPGDDKFRKFFLMQLKRHQNVTPESIRFLLHNCFVNSLDLTNIHNKQHKEGNIISVPELVPFGPGKTVSHCKDCTDCLKAALEGDSGLEELILNDLHIENFDGCAVNTNITRLSIYRTITSLELLKLFPNLEYFSMRNTQPPADVSPIERLARLKSLDLHNTRIRKILNFQNLTQLTSLNINDDLEKDMPNEDLDSIVNLLPNLENICFVAAKVTTLTALGSLKHLRSAQLSKCNNGEPLSALTNIKVLKLSDTAATKDTHWNAIGQLTQLEELEILPHFPADTSIMPHLAKLKNLKALDVQQNRSEDLEFLDAVSPGVERLHVSSLKFSPKITSFTNLKSLVLSISGPISDADKFYETVAKLTQLESLELSPMTNEGLGKLSTLINLKELNIRQQKEFDSSGAVHFKHFTKLRRASFYATPLSDLGLAHLTKLEQLEYLSLRRTSVSQEAIEFLENHRAYLELDTSIW